VSRAAGEENGFAIASEDHGICAAAAELRRVAAVFIVDRMMRVFDRADAVSAAGEVSDQRGDRRGLSASGLSDERDDVHATARASAVRTAPSSCRRQNIQKRSLNMLRWYTAPGHARFERVVELSF